MSSIKELTNTAKTNGLLQGLMLADELLTIAACPLQYRYLIINKANEIVAEYKQKESKNEPAQDCQG